jgi:hypothetical protein
MNTPVKIKLGPERIAAKDCLQPFLFQTRTGRLVLIGQMPAPPGAPYPGTWLTRLSDDQGETWRTWSQANVPGGSLFHEGCLVQLRDGTILILPWSARGPEAGGYWIAKLWESRDNWETVQGPFDARFLLPQAKGGFDDDGNPVPEVFLHRSLLETPNGDLLVTAYGWFEGDDTPSTYRPTMKKFRTLLLRSTDRGRNWSLVSTVAVGPEVGEEGFNEPVLLRLSKSPRAGRLIALLRTGSNKTFKHCPIHQTESDDDGRTWSKPHSLGWDNVDPDLIELGDGTLAASFGNRTLESRVHLNALPPKDIGADHGNYLAFSRDQGASWEPPIRINHEPSSCYTTIREIAPGKLIIVYDKGDWWQHVWNGWENIERAIACRQIEICIPQ